MPAVLFVCTANICRSPMAMALFRRQLELRGQLPRWRVESAGTWTEPGLPVSRRVQHVLRELGVDLGSHRSRCVEQSLLEQFQLILAMASSHQEALRLEFPQLAERIVLLSQMAGHAYDMPDPINGTLDDIRAVARQIKALLLQGFEEIARRTAMVSVS